MPELSSYRLTRHDVFIGLSVTYATAELVVTWQEFTCELLSECDQPLQVWLLVACITLTGFRGVHIMGRTEYFDDFDPWCFQLFSSRLQSFLLVGLLCPFLLVWVVLGTIWYIQAELRPSECFKDQQEGWYFILWLVIFYIWIVAYTTAIISSVLTYCRQTEFDNEYRILLRNYGDEPLPARPNWQINGLSPRSINKFKVKVLDSDSRHTCSICLDICSKAERVRILICGHVFHIACVDNWLMRQGNCPNCKRGLRSGLEEPLLVYSCYRWFDNDRLFAVEVPLVQGVLFWGT